LALVVLLRGVNVGGHRRFRPTVLANQLEHLGAVNIGAAGTFVIRESTGRRKLRDELAGRLPFNTQILICEGREILRLTSADPFAGEPARDDETRFLSVLARRPRTAPSLPLSLPGEGRWLVRILAREGRFVVGTYRRHMRTIGYLGKIDDLFGAPATTRSWNTVAAIANVLGQERGDRNKGGART